MTPESIARLLAAKPVDVAAEDLAARLRAEYGADAMKAGVGRDEGTRVVWAIEVSGNETPTVVTKTLSDDEPAYWVWERRTPVLEKGTESRKMQRLGSTDVYVRTDKLPNFSATAYEFEVAGRRQGGNWFVIESFPVNSDSRPHKGVPQGKVTQLHSKSSILAGTERDFWVYVPAQYKADGPPACLMVFQDGGMYLNPPASVPTVLDNLIQKGEIPMTVAVFIDPGHIPHEGKEPESTRIAEYHEQSDRYARFLRDEIIPEVGKIAKLRTDADSHAICGISSGAVCSFIAAWEAPDLFGKVICHVGSFTNILASHNYPFKIRETERKPLRIYLQDGSHDIDDICGNWPLANQQMAMALKFRGYDYRFDYGKGYHSLAHGGAVLPDTLRWIWRDYKATEGKP